MKVIVLAAGQGTRLRPLTDNIPKCMVPLKNKPLLEYQLDVFESLGIKDIHIATGYREDVINYPNIKKHFNNKFETTNMVYTLFCAEEIMNDDLIITYGDIIYKEDVLKKIIDSNEKVSVVVDKGWKAYWQARMDNPLADAETMKINENDRIVELGKKPKSYDDIQGQYIGMMKFSKEALKEIREYYHSLDKNVIYDGKDYENMYMTSFLQLIGDNLIPLKAVYINNGWMEVDCPEDRECTQFYEI